MTFFQEFTIFSLDIKAPFPLVSLSYM